MLVGEKVRVITKMTREEMVGAIALSGKEKWVTGLTTDEDGVSDRDRECQSWDVARCE